MNLKIYRHRGGWHWSLTNRGRVLARNARTYSSLETAEKGVGSTIVAMSTAMRRKTSNGRKREYTQLGKTENGRAYIAKKRTPGVTVTVL